MKLIKPSFNIISNIKNEDLKQIEKIGRICYKSEDKITANSYNVFVKNIVQNNHMAILEFYDITVIFTCDRGISHELVRHRLCSFAQESTRYCNYNKDKFGNQCTFILPNWINNITEGIYSFNKNKDIILKDKTLEISSLKSESWEEPSIMWLRHMLWSESTYLKCLKKKWTPQEARTILPNSLKTEIAVKANLREWKHIFNLRDSKFAHPQMREIIKPLHDEFKKILPQIF